MFEAFKLQTVDAAQAALVFLVFSQSCSSLHVRYLVDVVVNLY